MTDIFISYAKEDREQARVLAVALEELGWSVWWDRIIPTGRAFDEVIEEEIDAAKCVIVLWSSSSIRSDWVKAEASRAVEQKKLFPALTERVSLPLAFSRFQAADLVEWNGKSTTGNFPLLVGDISRILGTPPKQVEEEKREAKETAAARHVESPPAPIPPSPVASQADSWAADAKRGSFGLPGPPVLWYAAVGAILLLVLVLVTRPWWREPEEPAPVAQEEPLETPSTEEFAAIEADLYFEKLMRTVEIKVTRRMGEPVEYGSGVVICQENGRAYVLTAHHVLAGKSPQASGKNTLRMRRTSAVEISFYGNSPPPVGKDALTVYMVADEDLLLLTFALEQQLRVRRVLFDKPALVDEAAEEEDRPKVYAAGFWRDRNASWELRTGTLLPGAGKLLHHTADVPEGFAGGPLYNERGALIGINIERVAGQAIGAEIGAWYGEALSSDVILRSLAKWVPAECVFPSRRD